MYKMIRNWPRVALYRRPWPLSSAIAPQLDPSLLVEEENTPNYHPDRFYPIHLGQVLNERYQVATKIGHGANSTVWLARDLNRLACRKSLMRNSMFSLRDMNLTCFLFVVGAGRKRNMLPSR